MAGISEGDSDEVSAPTIGGVMPDGSVYAGISPDTGKAMYATPSDALLTYTFNGAAEYAEQLNVQKFLDHDDWRVPTKGELNVLFNNRAAMGGFNLSGSDFVGYYWSSSPKNNNGWDQRFSDGDQDWLSIVSSLRCVRG